MKKLTFWEIRTIKNLSTKVVYNKCSHIYTFIGGKNQVTLAQFDLSMQICTVRDIGYFLHFDMKQLNELLNLMEDNIIVMGGRRGDFDAKRKERKE